MSQGISLHCDIDIEMAETTEVLKKIVDEVFKDKGLSISLKQRKYHAKAYIRDAQGNPSPGYQENFGYGITIDVPRELASKKGIIFCPGSIENPGNVSICVGKEISKEEYMDPKFEGKVASSEEFQKRPSAMIMDNHRWDITHPDGVGANPALGKERDSFRDKVQECVGLAGAVGTALKGIKKMAEGGKVPEGGVEAVKEALTQKVLDAIRDGSFVISIQPKFPKTEQTTQKKSPGLLGPQPEPQQKPQPAKPLGLTH